MEQQTTIVDEQDGGVKISSTSNNTNEEIKTQSSSPPPSSPPSEPSPSTRESVADLSRAPSSVFIIPAKRDSPNVDRIRVGSTSSSGSSDFVVRSEEIVRDDYGFPIEPKYVEAYKQFLVAKHLNRKEKLKNKWKDFKMSETMVLSKKKLKAMMVSGTLHDLRGLLWCHCSGAFRKKENSDYNCETGNYYTELVKKTSSAKRTAAFEEIDKDIPRTFPELPQFNDEARNRVQRVLYAYAKRNKSLGYCQSMNFVAGWALLFMEEEDAFWLLSTIVEDYIPGYYSKNMLSIQVAHRILNELIAEKMPELYHHFEKLYVSLPLITTKWFMLLYIGSLPSETVARIWDTLFLEGVHILFRVGIAIFKLFEEELLATDNTIRICKLLKDRPLGVFDWKIVVKLAQKFTDIDEEKIELMRIKHRDDLLGELNELHHKRNIRELSKVTNFTQTELSELREQFEMLAKPKASIKRGTRTTVVFDFNKFKQVFCRVFPNWKEDDPALNQLFKAFDVDSDMVIDFREFMVGLSVLTSGTVDEKLEMCFKAYDEDSDGKISKDELKALLRGFFKNFFVQESETASPPNAPSVIGSRGVSQLVDICFMNLDVDESGKITLEEFRKISVIEPQLLECFQFEPAEQYSATSTQSHISEKPAIKLTDETYFTEGVIFQESTPPPEWEPDKAVPRCPHCSQLFVYPLKRRHHCRSCGKVVCHTCSRNTIPIPKFGYYRPVRVCIQCYRNFKEVSREKRPNKHSTTDLP